MIQKLTAMTSIDDMTPLLQILEDHALAKYFNSVKLVTNESSAGTYDKYYISCSVDDVEFLRIYASCGGNGSAIGGFEVTTSAGATGRFGITYGSSYYIGSVYVCSNGILMIPNSCSSAFALIAKDASGKTCFSCITAASGTKYIPNGSGITSGEGEYGVWAVSLDDTAPTNYDIYFNNADAVAGKYAFCPIYTESSSIKNAWTPIMRQFYDVELPLKITMDGATYLANRGIVILDA